MIIKEEKKRFPPGTLVTSFSTPQFNCIISTTWDGFISWRLTTGISIWYIIENESSWSPVMKVIWKSGLAKAQIHKLHNELVLSLDKFGEEGKDFGSALLYAFEPIEDKGLIFKIKYI
ncbi:MAG: hypothetical protein ACLQED_12200 [Desulfobaccales bacterium]